MSSIPWLRLLAASIGVVGLGYGLMKATVPTEEQLYNALAPDLQRQVDASRAARLAREESAKRQRGAQQHQDPDTSGPAWVDPPRS